MALMVSILLAAAAALLLLVARYVWIISTPRQLPPGGRAAKMLIVLGSGENSGAVQQSHWSRRRLARTRVTFACMPARAGGHTAEMLKLMDSMDKAKYVPRCYVVAATDSMSGKKAIAKEQSWEAPSKVRRLRCGTGWCWLHRHAGGLACQLREGPAPRQLLSGLKTGCCTAASAGSSCARAALCARLARLLGLA